VKMLEGGMELPHHQAACVLSLPPFWVLYEALSSQVWYGSSGGCSWQQRKAWVSPVQFGCRGSQLEPQQGVFES
jgi:hypothetical protein